MLKKIYNEKNTDELCSKHKKNGTVSASEKLWANPSPNPQQQLTDDKLGLMLGQGR